MNALLNTTKVRLPYIDIAKGILILFLLYGHSTLYTRLMGYDDASMALWMKFVPWYNSFFMPAFFIITGFCSSYKESFSKCLWKNFKTLLLPAIIIISVTHYLSDVLLNNDRTFLDNLLDLCGWVTDCAGPWFILALLWCKLAFWFLSRLTIKRQAVIIGTLYIFGLLLSWIDLFPNYLYHRHALLMLPFLAFGSFMKSRRDLMDKWIKPVAIFGVITISLQWILKLAWWRFPMPSLDLDINVHIVTFPVHIVNSISGTAFIVYISKLIGKNRFLQTLGKGTLLLYLANGLFQYTASTIAYAIIPSSGDASCLMIHIVAYLLCIAIGWISINIIYGTKYLSWIVGKW